MDTKNAHRFEDKTVLISGAARGQGRAHALRFAAEGANIVACDLCGQLPSNQYQMATPEDLAETVRLVEGLDRRIVAEQADVRDYDAVEQVVARGVAEFGPIDVVVPNAGCFGYVGHTWEIPQQSWDDVLGTNLMGAWNLTRAVIPAMIERGEGGAIVFTASAAGLRAYSNIGDYTVSKHAVIGLMRVLAQELGDHSIRVNAVCPTGVRTGIMVNDVVKKLFFPDRDPAEMSEAEYEEAIRPIHLLPTGLVEPEDVTAAILWLASEETRFITGVSLPVDAGLLEKNG